MAKLTADPKELIATLCAIECAAKDWHYASFGDTFHGNHKLADDVYDGRAGEQDDLQELFYLGHSLQAYPAVEKLAAAAKLLTHDPTDYVSCRTACLALLQRGKELCTALDKNPSVSVGERNAVDGIAENLEKVYSLVSRQAALESIKKE